MERFNSNKLAVAQFTEATALLRKRAQQHAAEGDFNAAILLYQKICQDCPNDTTSLIALGKISIEMGLLAEAKVFLLEALRLEPWHQEVRTMIKSPIAREPLAPFVSRIMAALCSPETPCANPK